MPANDLHDLSNDELKRRSRIIGRGIRGIADGKMRALVEGSILAVLVVFAFLRDLRATIISAVV